MGAGSGCATGRDFRLPPMATPPDSSAEDPAGTPPAEPPPAELTLKQVAARAGVTTATVRRWVNAGLVPQYDGEWTPAAASHVRSVARLRERGHSVRRVGEASPG